MITGLLYTAILIAFAVIGISVATLGFFGTFVLLCFLVGGVFALFIAAWMFARWLFVGARRRQAVLHG